MKIHIAASKKFFDNPNVRVDLIEKVLIDLGHSVQIKHIYTPQAKHPESFDFQSEYKKVRSWIKSADVLIADITTPSNGVGHEIFLALNEGKPVLVLHAYSEKDPRDISLRGNPSKLLTTKSYTTETLPEILENFCKVAKSKLDTKFILIIPPAIDKYLKWVADERRMHKAQVVRQSIEDTMKKDKEYKDYLKSVEV